MRPATPPSAKAPSGASSTGRDLSLQSSPAPSSTPNTAATAGAVQTTTKPSQRKTDAPCSATDLVLTAVGDGSYTLHAVTLFDVRNRGRLACTLHGFPDVLAVTSAGATVPIRVTTTLSRTPQEAALVVATITLSPGATAGFIETVSGKPLELACVPPRGGRVYLPLPAGGGRLTDPTPGGLCPGTSVAVTPFYTPAFTPAATTSAVDTTTAAATPSS